MQKNKLTKKSTSLEHPKWWEVFDTQKYLTQYDVEFAGKRTVLESDFIEKASGMSHIHIIVDIACGQGRHVNELAKRGYSTTGVDIGENALKIGQTEAKKNNIESQFVQADMRKPLPFKDEAFDIAYNVFTSFGYFTVEEDQQFLYEVNRILKPRGTFLIDVLSLEVDSRDFFNNGTFDQEFGSYKIGPLKRFMSGQERTQTRWFDPITQIVHTRREWEEEGKPIRYDSYLREYRVDQLDIMLKKAGLIRDSLAGDYEGNPHDTNENTRTIIVARKSS